MQQISFIIINNPLIPQNRQIEVREFARGKSLHDYIGDLEGRWIISHNGKMLSVEELKTVYPEPGDAIAICPEINGGGEEGDGKSIIRMVAMVALIAFTYGQGAYSLGGLMGAGSPYLAAAQMAVMVGGTLLINALLPPQINQPTAEDRSAETYGIDGPKNTSREGLPVPLIYGRHRVAGNIIGNFTEMTGQTQFLNLLLNLGEGVTAGVTRGSLMLSGQSVTDLQEQPTLVMANGNDGQIPPDNFSRQVIPYPVTVDPELVDPNVWTRYVTSIDKDVESLRLDFTCTLFNLDNKRGEEWDYRVDAVAECRPFGSTNELDFESIINDIDPNYGNQGIIFDYVEANGRMVRFNPNGKPITKVKAGVQYINEQFPNRYNEETGLYLNAYSDVIGKNSARTLIPGSLRVTRSGEVVSSAFADETSSMRVDVYHEILPSIALNPPSFSYGNVVCEGKIVGKYHDFHAKNYLASGFNDQGSQMGSVAGRILSFVGSNSTSLVRFSYSTKRLKPGRYEVRVRRTVKAPDNNKIAAKVTLSEVNEVTYDKLGYNHTALLSMRMRVTDRLRGIPNVTVESRGIVIAVWDDEHRRWVPSCLPEMNGQTFYRVTKREAELYGTPLTPAQNEEVATGIGGGILPNHLALKRPAHTLPVVDSSKYDSNGFYQHSNPAWIAWDILTNKRYGAGFDPRRLDFWAFRDWAKHCVEENLQFDGIFGDKESVWDAISKVFRIGRAVPVRMGTRYSVSIEKPKAPVMRFGQDNILSGTFSTAWLPTEDRANEIEISYYDRENDYQQSIVKVYDEVALANGAKPVVSSIELRGIVNQEQVLREANYILNTNKLTQTVTFDAPIESLACTIGDVVTVQHDMMEWGLSGKLRSHEKLPDGRLKMVLDQSVDFDLTTDQWKMIFVADAVSRGTFKVKNHYGAYVTLENFTPSVGRINRAKVGTKEHGVLEVFESGTGEYGVVLDTPYKLAVGNMLSLWDTDCVLTIPVTALSDTEVVTVQSVAFIPNDLQGFMLGHERFISREFSIRSISLTNDTMTRRITGLEYNAGVFDDSTSMVAVTDPTVSRKLKAVDNLSIVESAAPGVGEPRFRLNLSWSHESSAYASAHVTATVGSITHNLGRSYERTHIDLPAGRVVEFSVTPIDAFGAEGATRTFRHTVVGALGNNTTPGSFQLTPNVGMIHLSWTVANAQSYYKTEVFGIKVGTVISMAGANTAVTEANAGAISEQDVINGAEVIGATASLELTHQIQTPGSVGETYCYWARTENSAGNDSTLVYAGSATSLPLVSFNNSSAYFLANDKPLKPVGGTYSNPFPTSPGWYKTPPVRTPSNASMQLWVSSRAFANNPSLGDSAWSEPAPVASVGFNTVTVYALSVSKPAKPTGGTYDTARPTETIWSLSIPQRPVGDNASVLWVSSRRFASSPSLSDSSWAEPSQFHVPNEARFSWTAYASNNMGANFATLYDAGIHKFIGRATNKRTETPSANWRDYEWGLIISDLDQIVSSDDRAKINEAYEIVGSVGSIRSDVTEVVAKVGGFETEMGEMSADLETAANNSIEAMLVASREGEERRRALYNESVGAFPMIDAVRGMILETDGSLSTHKSETTAQLNSVKASVTSLTESLASTDASLASAKTTVSAELNNIKSSVTSLTTSLATANSTVSSLDTRLTSEINGVKGSVTSLTTSLAATDKSLADHKTATTAEFNGVKASVNTLNSSMAAANTAIANNKSELQASISANSALITSNHQAIVGTNGAIAKKADELKADYNSQISATNSSLSNSIASVDGALSSYKTSTDAKFVGLNGSTVQGAINTLNTTITGTNGAISQAENRINAKFGTMTGATVSASIENLNQAITGTNGAISQAENRINAKFGTMSGATVSASIENLNQAITGPTGSLASTKSTITAEYNSKISSSITNYNSVLVSPTGEIGLIKTQLTTTNGTLTQVQTVADGVDGKFEAQWGIKGTYGSMRYGVGLVNKNGKVRFAVQADDFVLLPTAASADTAVVSPFSIVGGVAFLNNAMINTAHIVKLFTDELKASQVTANNLLITGGSINVANRFVVSNTGAVSISGAGTSRMELTNDGMVVYNNGVVVARIGKLA